MRETPFWAKARTIRPASALSSGPSFHDRSHPVLAPPFFHAVLALSHAAVTRTWHLRRCSPTCHACPLSLIVRSRRRSPLQHRRLLLRSRARSMQRRARTSFHPTPLGGAAWSYVSRLLALHKTAPAPEVLLRRSHFGQRCLVQLLDEPELEMRLSSTSVSRSFYRSKGYDHLLLPKYMFISLLIFGK